MRAACGAALLSAGAGAITPFPHSWDTVGGMSFFHACNESGPFSARALDTIARFPVVTIEKGQGFDADDCAEYGATFPCAEQKIIAQCEAVKKRNASVATVFYMNSVLSWYFYHMDVDMKAHAAWPLKDSATGEAVHTGGDRHFDPPKGGMLVFGHALKEMREYWKAVCINATKTGFVDGCFSDSSQPGSHNTDKYLNDTDRAAYEAGKVQTMTEMTAYFGGKAGGPFSGSTGVLIGKKSNQEGVSAYQIEFFEPNEASIEELIAGANKGWFVQAHAATNGPVSASGCNALPDMTDSVAAFLIGAGDFSYYGSGPWISPNIADVEQRWCSELFDKPVGAPAGPAVKSGKVYTRSFASGTKVTFDTATNKGTIHWAGEPTPPTPAPPAPGDCSSTFDGGIAGNDISPLPWGDAPTAAECCAKCWDMDGCVAWTWYSGGTNKTQCHQHSSATGRNTHKQRISGIIR